jgi:hypothetical protein
MNRKWNLLKKLVYQRRTLIFYTYDPKQGLGQTNPHVNVYASWSEIPVYFRRTAVPTPWRNPMYYRLKRGQAKLLCYSEGEQRLASYLWIQDWRLFRRKYGRFAQTGVMLGYGWTDPEMRGRGLLGRLLLHSLSLCSKDSPILCCIAIENKASQRAVGKAGFRPVGAWDFQMWFGLWARLRPIPSQAEGTSDGIS